MLAFASAVTLSAFAAGALEDWQADGKSAATATKIEVSPHRLGFGKSTAPLLKFAMVSNHGSQAVVFSVSPLSPPFSVIGPINFITLPPKSVWAVEVEFAPQTNGDFRSSLTITVKGSSKTLQVALQGKGKGLPTPTPTQTQTPTPTSTPTPEPVASGDVLFAGGFELTPLGIPFVS